MTDPDVVDKTYIEPITLDVLEKFSKKKNQMQFYQPWVELHLISMEAEKKEFKKYKIGT